MKSSYKIKDELDDAEKQLEKYRDLKEAYEEKYDILMTFIRKYNTESSIFSRYMRCKKNNSSKVKPLLTVSNIAKGYNFNATSLLSGIPYNNFLENMNEIENKLREAKRKLEGKMENAEENITYYKNKVQNLEVSYRDAKQEEIRKKNEKNSIKNKKYK